MPIVGMMSVFDWSEVLEMHHQWTGREWFVARISVSAKQRFAHRGPSLAPHALPAEVKKAEVRLAEEKR